MQDGKLIDSISWAARDVADAGLSGELFVELSKDHAHGWVQKSFPKRKNFILPKPVPVFRRGFSFLDIEMTGLDPEKNVMVEIAIIRDGVPWETKLAISPTDEQNASPEAMKVNGYNRYEWEDAPCWEDVCETVALKLHGAFVVGHNISFDLGFLNKAFVGSGIDPYEVMPPGSTIDTYGLAKAMFSGSLGAFKLDAVCEHLGIPPEGVHRAMGGATRCRQIFSKLHEIVKRGYRKPGQEELKIDG